MPKRPFVIFKWEKYPCIACLFTGWKRTLKWITVFDMRIRISCILLGLLAAFFSLPHQTWAMEKGRFLTIIDGDSLLVGYKGRSQEVRLIGIDAPEWGQEYGTRAKSHALTVCYGQDLKLEFDREQKDRYGRLLAYVYCGNTMLNKEMIRAGLAITIKIKPNTRYYDEFKALEKKARAELQGFWLRGGLKQTPAQWRKNKRK